MSLITIDMPHLNEVKQLIESDITNHKTLVVFDLDSTLFNVTPRSAKILDDLKNNLNFQSKYSQYYPQLENVIFDHGDWGIKEALVRANVVGPLEMFETIRQHWVKHFFSNEYLQFDRPYNGAIEFVKKLSGLGATINYLTGRDIPRMKPGTIRSLLQHGFPLSNELNLIMKPESGLQDEAFKSDHLNQLKNNYEKVWFFENEPVISNYVQKNIPQIKVVFLDTVHSKKQEPENPTFILKGRY